MPAFSPASGARARRAIILLLASLPGLVLPVVAFQAPCSITSLAHARTKCSQPGRVHRGWAARRDTERAAPARLEPVAPLRELVPPLPPPVQMPVSLGRYAAVGIARTVREAWEWAGARAALMAGLRSVWILLDAFLLSTIQSIPIGLKVISFYKKGLEEGIHKDVLYGDLPHQLVDVYLPQGGASQDSPIVLFVHGGSWATGEKWHYSLQAKRLREEGAVVACVRYGLFPQQCVDGMVRDIGAALDWALLKCPTLFGGDAKRVVLSAHSAGSHVCAMAMIERARGGGGGRMPRKVALASGPYDIPRHYEHERTRGVHIISPMHTAMGSGVPEMNANSPLYALTPEVAAALPECVLMHSRTDKTVPVRSSEDMHAAMLRAGARARFVDLGDDCGHNKFITDLMLGVNSQGARAFLEECTLV